MPRTSEKGKNNPYYLARMVASKSNDRLSSRAGASEVLGISEKRITWIENNLTNPYPEEVVIMASLYNAPTLENLYCSTVCPLKGLPVIEENKTLSEIAISAGLFTPNKAIAAPPKKARIPAALFPASKLWATEIPASTSMYIKVSC